MAMERVEFEVDNTLRVKERVVLIGIVQSKSELPKLYEYRAHRNILSNSRKARQ